MRTSSQPALTLLLTVSLVGCGQSSSHSKDAGISDLTMPDLAMPDLAIPDLAIPDLAIPDLAIPDLAMPDLTMPDLTMPDLTMPDLTMPDLAIPDLAMPDLAMPDLFMCPSGQSVCDDTCVNLDNDANHCGYCDNACGTGQTCEAGECCNSVCGGICCNDQCINGECCTTCADRADYYAERYQHCMDTDDRGASYCQGWMGCVGPVEVPGYGTVTGTCGQI